MAARRALRVLHVTPFLAPAPAFGGIARASLGLARAQAEAGHRVTVVTARLGRGQPAEGDEHGVRVRRFGAIGLSRRLPLCPGAGRWLHDAVADADVVHLHGHRHGLALAARAACARRGRPWILQPHGTWPDHGQHRTAKALFDALGGRAVVRGASALVAVSEAEARELPGPSHVVPNGVELPVPVRSPRPRGGGPSRLLFVGGPAPQKRVEALAPLLAALPSATLALVGPFGDVPGALRSVRDRVQLRGCLDDEALAVEYAGADLLVQPAVGEAFGLVAFEAASMGTAAIVSADHGAGEWLARAGGCTVPPEDPAAWIAAVRERLEQPERARAEAARVAAFAARELTWARAAQRCDAVYAALPGVGVGRA